MTVDGRAIFDNEDYKLSLDRWKREKLGYLRFSATEYRTWYNGDGGFYPPADLTIRWRETRWRWIAGRSRSRPG